MGWEGWIWGTSWGPLLGVAVTRLALRLALLVPISAWLCFPHMCRHASAWSAAQLLRAQHPPTHTRSCFSPTLSCSHDEYREGEEVLELPCGHNYHADCLLPWLETHNTCPGGCFDSLLLAWSW